MEKYYIRYSVSREQVIIPHFDIDGNLIGIRGRNLNDFALLNGKYMPVKIEGKFYSHPLSYNLYGLNFTKESIARKKIVFIFEGEKSTLLSDSWYDENSVAVSTCGNKLNKFQVNLLMKLGFFFSGFSISIEVSLFFSGSIRTKSFSSAISFSYFKVIKSGIGL